MCHIHDKSLNKVFYIKISCCRAMFTSVSCVLRWFTSKCCVMCTPIMSCARPSCHVHAHTHATRTLHARSMHAHARSCTPTARPRTLMRACARSCTPMHAHARSARPFTPKHRCMSPLYYGINYKFVGQLNRETHRRSE